MFTPPMRSKLSYKFISPIKYQVRQSCLVAGIMSQVVENSKLDFPTYSCVEFFQNFYISFILFFFFFGVGRARLILFWRFLGQRGPKHRFWSLMINWCPELTFLGQEGPKYDVCSFVIKWCMGPSFLAWPFSSIKIWNQI